MSKQHFNGNPIVYQISYYPTGLEERLRFVTVNYTQNYTELHNLTVFTQYFVNVSAVSSGGVGPGAWPMAGTDADGEWLNCEKLTRF